MVKSIDDAVAMVEAICHLPENRSAIRRQEAEIRSSGLQQAIIAHDTAFLYGWLMEAFSLQGISDTNALSYIEAHGNAEWKEIKKHLRKYPPACFKLKAFEVFKKCGYRKIAQTCNVPDLIGSCLVPQLPLRKGDLNQLALSLYLFIRDVCRGDLVAFIDGALSKPAIGEGEDLTAEGRQTLVKAFKPIFGIGPKLISMSLSWILIAGGRHRRKGVKIGRSMIVIDSLVHNFLHRSGILKAYRRPHAYGTACYGPKGCEAVLRDIAAKIDLKALNQALPSDSPRLIQLAIWRFCGESALEICNGRNIDDRKRCSLVDCPVRSHCSRVALFPAKPP